MKKFFIVLVFLISVPAIVFAHEEVEANVYIKYLFPLWDFHDAIHWMVAIPFIGSCYYFRHFSGRKIFSHPKLCAQAEQKTEYKGETKFVMLHRYFFWAMLILIIIHLSETITKSLGMITYNFKLFSPYIFPFTSEATVIQSETVQIIGTIAEWFYVVTLLVFLFSCHFFRHLLGGKFFCFSCSPAGNVRGKLYHLQTKLNNYHGILFWLSISSMVFILILGGHL